jgi:hypothetical protein
MKPAQFWPAAKAYQPRSGLTYRLFRLWPVIDRELTGHEEHSIDVQTEMDSSYVLRTHGSGDYKLFLHDANRPRGHSEVCYTILEINDPSWPPILDYDELVVGHKRNQGFIEGLKARGLWPARPEGRHRGGEAGPYAEMASLAKAVLERAPRESPGMQQGLDLVKKGFEMVMERELKAPENAEASPLLLQLMKQNHEMVMALVRDRQTAPAAPAAASPVETMNQLMELGERFASLRGEGPRAGPWSSAFASLPQILEASLGVFQTLLAMRGLPAAGHAPAGELRQPKSVAAPDTAASVPTGAIPMMPGFDVSTIALIGQDAVAAFQIGVTGDSFAEAVERKYGESVYVQVAALGKQAILAALQAYQQVWAQVQPRLAEIERFIDDFISYGLPEAEPDGKPEGALPVLN